MNSCLYKAKVMHYRASPKQHRFSYNIFMFYVDLDELDLLSKRLWMFSLNRFNFFSFRDKEHLQANPETARGTKQEIVDYLDSKGIDITGGRIMLLTNMNVLGYNFNPVSFYYCFDRENKPLCCIAEVGNTFGEMKPYLLDRSRLSGKKFRLTVKKYFYVSPFIDHDVDFDFDLTVPEDKLALKIDDIQKGKRFFYTTLTGHKQPLTGKALLFYALSFPLITLRIISLIHWQAFRLWLKKLPYHRKSENQGLQKGVYKKFELIKKT